MNFSNTIKTRQCLHQNLLKRNKTSCKSLNTVNRDSQTIKKRMLTPNYLDANNVFIRNDVTRSPLHPTYDGPYEVLLRTPKYFKVLRNSRNYTVSVDTLKSANLLSDFECQNEIKMTKRPSISGDDNHNAPHSTEKKQSSTLYFQFQQHKVHKNSTSQTTITLPGL